MKNQITNTMNKVFAFVAMTMILTVAAFAQMPTTETKSREQIAALLHRQVRIEIGSKGNDTAKIATDKKSAAVLSNQNNFIIGKDFALAMFDAAALEDYEEALSYTIVDLVYLIDRLEGQPEVVQLQKTLKKVVRGTSTAIEIRKEIETVSKTYLNRQKADQKWYVNAGTTTMNLSISTYLEEDAAIKKGLAELQALIKIAPKGTPQEVIDPMNVLAKYVTKTAFTEADYAAMFEEVGEVINAVSA